MKVNRDAVDKVLARELKKLNLKTALVKAEEPEEEPVEEPVETEIITEPEATEEEPAVTEEPEDNEDSSESGIIYVIVFPFWRK